MPASLTSFSTEHPLLLATDFPPTAGGGGAVILRSLLGEEDRRRILWASPALAPDFVDPSGLSVPLRRGSSRFAGLLKRRSQTVDGLLSSALADELLEVARARGARAIWLVLHGALVHVAARLVGRSPLPVHVTVHDDPPYGVALLSRRYVALVPAIARDFSRALRGARSIDVVGDGMARRYEERYGVRSIVVHRGMSRAVAASPARPPSSDLEVGLLGNTYGYDQLPLLVEAIARAAAQAGAKGRLVVLGQGHGQRLREQLGARLEIEVAGHLDEPAAVARLQRCFLLYLNYPFARRARMLRETSFPTKLSTYVQAARPLLVHAPRGSSIAPLADLPEYARWWASEDPDDGAATILRAWRSADAAASQHVPAEEVRRRFYDFESNQRALFGALNALAS